MSKVRSICCFMFAVNTCDEQFVAVNADPDQVSFQSGSGSGFLSVRIRIRFPFSPDPDQVSFQSGSELFCSPDSDHPSSLKLDPILFKLIL